MKYGGKAESLLFLEQNKILVPEFFIITEEDYINFLIKNKIYSEIKTLFLNKQYKKIKELINKQQITKDLKEKIKKNILKINSNLYAVRSSATNEDGENKSYAGQYDSFLNIKKEELFENIKNCWCSLYNENVIRYSNDFDIYGMNVVIQKMIEPDYSGVIFSIDPSSETRNYTIIEMVEGLGEKLVSGKVTPTKFFIRKKTKRIDLKLGNLNIEKKRIDALMENVEKIEKIYNKPMDIEYAITNDNCYIVQARPITAKSPLPKTFDLSLTRQKPIIDIEIYYRGEYEGIKKVTRNLYYFKPLFIFNPEENNVSIYYNGVDLEELPEPMYYYLDLDFDKTLKYYEKIKTNIKYLDTIIDNKKELEYKSYIEKIIEIYPLISLGQLAGHFNEMTKRVKDLLIEFREKYDYIIYKAVDYLVQKVKEKLPKEYQEYIDFLKLEETVNNNLPSIEELEKRKQGYIYYNGKLYITKDYNPFFYEHNISIAAPENNLLTGTFTYFSGKSIKGRVCKIMSDKDFSSFKENDIIVTPMTSPKFLSILKHCQAIITDEGGITSHAAIISRELKIPCLVGTRGATKHLSTGEIIEITPRGEIKKTE